MLETHGRSLLPCLCGNSNIASTRNPGISETLDEQEAASYIRSSETAKDGVNPGSPS